MASFSGLHPRFIILLLGTNNLGMKYRAKFLHHLWRDVGAVHADRHNCGQYIARIPFLEKDEFSGTRNQHVKPPT